MQTFFEESFEGLDIMESGLLGLGTGEADRETINDIFRAAHSIKGGSGTFGLTQIASFTHVVESILDEMRDGKRKATQDDTNLLLESVDCLRGMLMAGKENTELDTVRIKDVHDRLEALWGKGSSEAVSGASDIEMNTDVSDTVSQGWLIKFKPLAYILKTGNEPWKMFRELGNLGEIRVTANMDNVPDFDDHDPEEVFVAWTIELQGNASKAQIEEVFAWVEDDCELVITPVANTESETSSVTPLQAVAGNKGASASATKRSGQGAENASIRVGIDKVDSIIDLVGELVITQSMLSTTGKMYPMLKTGLAQLERNTRELQEQVMRMRMLPVSFVFNRFPRLIHDLSQKLGKQIELEMHGEGTELDKTVIEKVTDPLVHLIRNSVDHGIEKPADRIAAGKPATGKVVLSAYHKGGNIVIEIRDDGKGIDPEVVFNKAVEKGMVDANAVLDKRQIFDLILQPGFSTAAVVSDVSGRGVGMDVVKRNMETLGGSIDIESEKGVGSTFTVRLPLTLAILDGQTISVGEEHYIIPIVSIIESIRVKPNMLNHIAGKGETFAMRNEYIPIVRLHEVFECDARFSDITKGLLVVVESDGNKVGLFVDDLLGQQQVVIKSLEANYKKVDGISGATILGDGSVALILDIPGLYRLSRQMGVDDHIKKSA